MSDIYTGIDLGTDSIKIVVCEKVEDKYHVLAAESYAATGIKNGFIIDIKNATNSVKNAVKKINEKLGIPISKVIACVPPYDCRMDIVSGNTTVVDENDISGLDVSNVMQDALKKYEFNDTELVTAMPIHFTIDEDTTVRDPKGLKGANLTAKVVVGTTPKDELLKILEVLKLSGLETIDICFSSFGDYYCFKEKNFDDEVGVVINIGEEATNVSIFNRGIQIKNGVIAVGSKNVDKDLTYAFKSKLTDSRKIKESFALATKDAVESDNTWTVKIDRQEEKKISQENATKVVEARVREILKLAKNEIKNLTNREIRYIIITGGLTELEGFPNLAEEIFGFIVRAKSIPVMGIRHNKYSSCFGIIKYFNDKLSLRGKDYNMFTNEEVKELLDLKKNTAFDNLSSKVLDHPQDN